MPNNLLTASLESLPAAPVANSVTQSAAACEADAGSIASTQQANPVAVARMAPTSNVTSAFSAANAIAPLQAMAISAERSQAAIKEPAQAADPQPCVHSAAAVTAAACMATSVDSTPSDSVAVSLLHHAGAASTVASPALSHEAIDACTIGQTISTETAGCSNNAKQHADAALAAASMASALDTAVSWVVKCAGQAQTSNVDASAKPLCTHTDTRPGNSTHVRLPILGSLAYTSYVILLQNYVHTTIALDTAVAHLHNGMSAACKVLSNNVMSRIKPSMKAKNITPLSVLDRSHGIVV